MQRKAQIILCIFLFVAFMNQGFSQESKVRDLSLRLENYTYPYPVKLFIVKNQGQQLEMAYMDEKPANFNGRSIMLMHGKNFNGAYWRSTMKALLKKGFRVVVPDQIGFGKSSKPRYFQYSFQQLAENTKHLLEKLNIDKITVLGHSMGGMVATRFALMYPETTAKFVLVNPIGLEDWKLVVPYKPVDWWYARELKADYASIKKYQMASYYAGKWSDTFDEWARLQAGWTLDKDYPLIAWNAALTYEMIFTQPVCYEFSHIQAPTLLIIGTRDRTALGKDLVAPEVAAKLGRYDSLGKKTRDKIPGAQLVELDDVGHLPQMEAFDRFFKPLLTFLES